MDGGRGLRRVRRRRRSVGIARKVSLVIAIVIVGCWMSAAGGMPAGATAGAHPSGHCLGGGIVLSTGLQDTVAVGVAGGPATSTCSSAVPVITNAVGQVFDFPYLPTTDLHAPIVAIAATVNGNYWLAGADGGVFAMEGAWYFGSAADLDLRAPIVGIAATPDDRGYYLVGADGGVFAFGDAVFRGSMAGSNLNASIVGIAVDPLTGGYRLVARDGGVFDFGAPFLGSMAGAVLAGPVVGIASDAATGGYWLAGADGGVFAFGAAFNGSWVSDPGRIVGIGSASGEQYFLADSAGDLADCPPGGQGSNSGPPLSSCLTAPTR